MASRSIHSAGVTLQILLGISFVAYANHAFAQTQPAAQQPTVQLDPRKVLVLAFEQIGGEPAQQFVSKAMQQGIVGELSRAGGMQAVSSDKIETATTAAVELARSAGAQYVVSGSYQI